MLFDWRSPVSGQHQISIVLYDCLGFLFDELGILSKQKFNLMPGSIPSILIVGNLVIGLINDPVECLETNFP